MLQVFRSRLLGTGARLPTLLAAPVRTLRNLTQDGEWAKKNLIKQRDKNRKLRLRRGKPHGPIGSSGLKTFVRSPFIPFIPELPSRRSRPIQVY